MSKHYTATLTACPCSCWLVPYLPACPKSQLIVLLLYNYFWPCESHITLHGSAAMHLGFLIAIATTNAAMHHPLPDPCTMPAFDNIH